MKFIKKKPVDLPDNLASFLKDRDLIEKVAAIYKNGETPILLGYYIHDLNVYIKIPKKDIADNVISEDDIKFKEFIDRIWKEQIAVEEYVFPKNMDSVDERVFSIEDPSLFDNIDKLARRCIPTSIKRYLDGMTFPTTEASWETLGIPETYGYIKDLENYLVELKESIIYYHLSQYEGEDKTLRIYRNYCNGANDRPLPFFAPYAPYIDVENMEHHPEKWMPRLYDRSIVVFNGAMHSSGWHYSFVGVFKAAGCNDKGDLLLEKLC